MTKFYGLLGAQRTGKTTLAIAVAEEMGVPFFKTTVSAAMAILGVSPQADLPFHQRLMVQNAILESLMVNYRQALEQHPDAPIIVVDRTPLDVLAYTRSEILRETMTSQLEEEMSTHERRCIEMMNFHFAGACLVPPGIPLVACDGSAPANVHYQRHVHATMIDAALDERVTVPVLVLGSATLKLESRVTDTVEHCESIIFDLQLTESTHARGATLH